MSFRTTLRHVLYELRGGFLLVPGAMMVLCTAIALALVWGQHHDQDLGSSISAHFFFVPSDPAVAQLVLSSIAGSIMTVLSVVYSVLLLVLTFASMQFSPRIIVFFMKDRSNQVTLGSFLGTFAFCLTTLPSIRSGERPFVPTAAVSVAMFLAAVSLVVLVYFVHHVALSIQANSLVQRTAIETETAIAGLFSPHTRNGAPSSPAGAPLHSQVSGYLQFIERDELIELATSHNVTIRLLLAIGQFVPSGMAIAMVTPAERSNADLVRAALRAIHLGPVRTMEDDPEFGVLQIVDVALRAVSPAVNDPSTAIACIDYLSEILAITVSRSPPPAELPIGGPPRLVLKQTSFARLLNLAFDQIAHYTKTDRAVCLRLFRALNDVGLAARDDESRRLVRARARDVFALCEGNFPAGERAELAERMALVEATTEPAATTAGA
jgi:uncharacterized membrane protein